MNAKQVKAAHEAGTDLAAKMGPFRQGTLPEQAGRVRVIDPRHERLGYNGAVVETSVMVEFVEDCGMRWGRSARRGEKWAMKSRDLLMEWDAYVKARDAQAQATAEARQRSDERAARMGAAEAALGCQGHWRYRDTVKIDLERAEEIAEELLTPEDAATLLAARGALSSELADHVHEREIELPEFPRAKLLRIAERMLAKGEPLVTPPMH